jgi:acetyl esterase/lipase
MRFATRQFIRVISLSAFRDNSTLPTFTKSYPCQPALKHRIFIPKAYKSGDPLLPLYLDIHGGGFAILDPIVDDKFCANLANRHKVLVVSLDYPKTPAHKFPTPVEQLVDVAKAVISDDALPIDKKKVAIGGFSAGANLSLAVVQDKDLTSKIGAVVGVYPPVDWTTSLEWKLSTRPKDAGKDLLEDLVFAFDWAYLKPDQDLRDPQLSITYAPREKLPPKLYIIGCELDLLCKDAEIMSEKFAALGDGKRVGTNEVWEQNGIKWEKVMGEEHG